MNEINKIGGNLEGLCLLALRLNLLLGSNPDGITKKSRELMFIPDLSNFVVRPAGFEPAAYGFEVRTSEFSNLLNLL